jgi:putative protein-disulfide isomerase
MQRPQLIYFYDALCGWCYGFSPVAKRLAAQFEAQADFIVMSGGMVTGARVAPIAKMAAYIEQAYPKVEQTTGVKFGEDFLRKILRAGSYTSNSLPPALALTAFKSNDPQNQVSFAHALQRAFYYDGDDLNSDETYQKLATQFGMNADRFISQMHDEKTLHATLEEFNLVQSMGVNGFPSLALLTEQGGALLAVGYRDFNSLQQAIESKL